MIVVGEFNLDINLVAGFGIDQLVFKTGDKSVGAELKRIVAAFAALKFDTVNRTAEIDDQGVALFGLTAGIFNFYRFAAGADDILQSLFDFFGRNFGHQLFDFDVGKIADFNFRQGFGFHVKFDVFAFVKFGDADARTQSQFQLVFLDHFVGGVADHFVQSLAHNRSAVFLFQHFFGGFARTETRKFDVFGDFVQFLLDFCLKVFVFNNHLIFFLQAFCFLFCYLHFLLCHKMLKPMSGAGEGT